MIWAIKMAGAAGLEPVTSAVTGQRSNQLSYAPTEGDLKAKKSSASSQWGIKNIFVAVLNTANLWSFQGY
jgi:hypothetical protein